MKVSVIGTGYVGLVSGVCLSEKGHQVICVDKDLEKVEQINRGIPPIFEEGLTELLVRNVPGRLRASGDLDGAITDSEISLIAVGTPFDGARIDLSYIVQAAEEIGAVLANKSDYHTVVVKSTVVPGTTEGAVKEALERTSGKKAGVDFGLGMNPEFLREGAAISDFMDPDRIVLGGIDERTLDAMGQLYAVFEGADVIRTSPKTAEMIKYTANSLLATLISFSNEIGNLCAALGDIDVVDVMAGVHLDRRLSPITERGERIVPALTTYLAAGCGFGGSCFPKDVKALVAHGVERQVPMPLLESVLNINASQPGKIIELLQNHFADLSDVRIAVLGLAFKPGTDDMRESPAIPIVNHLLERGARISAYDPVAAEEARKLFGNGTISYAAEIADAIAEADAVIIVTRWPDFGALPEMIKALPAPPLVIDGRRMLDRSTVARYEGIGLKLS